MTTTASRKPRPRKPAADRSTVSQANRYAAPTDKQLAYAESLAKQRGYRFGVREAYRDMCGKSRVVQPKRAEIARLIDWLAQKD